MTALVEGMDTHDPALVTGRLGNNIMVHFPGDASDIGKILPVRLLSSKGFIIWGKGLKGNERAYPDVLRNRRETLLKAGAAGAYGLLVAAVLWAGAARARFAEVSRGGKPCAAASSTESGQEETGKPHL